MVDAARHVFISFSSRDLDAAQAICKHLEASSVRCWLSSRNVEPGANYQASIVSAIKTAAVMVVVFSDNTNRSQEVSKELALASAMNVYVMPVRITDVQPNGALMYELATRQWIDAFDDWDAAMRRLVATMQAILTAPAGETDARRPSPMHVNVPKPAVPLATATVPAAAPPTPPPAAAPAFSKDQLDAARAALSFHIGPIADVLVRKASVKATTLPDLYERLAAHIQSADAQTAFRKRLGIRT